MNEVPILDLDPAVSIDPLTDFLPIANTALDDTFKINRSVFLGITGSPVGTTDTQVLTNKTVGNTNTITSLDSLFTLQDNADNTKQAQFQLSGITTATTRTYTLPNASSTLADISTAQTLTNKTLTSPVITGGTISNSSIAVNSIAEFTAAAGVTIDGVLLKDAKMNGSYLTDSTVGNAALALGVPVQKVATSFSSMSTGTTTIPLDDSIPQNTEGTEFMTQAITPKSATNILVIEIIFFGAISVSPVDLIIAVFQDSTANAVAATASTSGGNNYRLPISVNMSMTAGTTSSTTFKVRAGPATAGTVTFNGTGGARLFGAITKSSIVITEYKA